MNFSEILQRANAQRRESFSRHTIGTCHPKKRKLEDVDSNDNDDDDDDDDSEVMKQLHSQLYQFVPLMAKYSPGMKLLLELGSWKIKEARSSTRKGEFRGKPKQCFYNAFISMDYNVYVGMATTLPGVFLVDHAWNVDNNGTVCDPTFPVQTRAAYFGMKFPMPVLMTIINNNDSRTVNYIDAIRYLPEQLQAEVIDQIRTANTP